MLLSPESIAALGAALFRAAGTPDDDARQVAAALVTSSLMGHDSHGVLRIPEYLDLIAAGRIIPGAAMTVAHECGATAVVDCGHNFGVLGAHRAVAEAMRLARTHCVACVVTHRCAHVGRVGAYVQAAAAQGFVALATCNSPIYGHFVLPWGGREGRLATNPIAYAIPTSGDPVLADISTSVVPEGKVRVYRNQGQPLPPGWVLDAGGRPTTDAAAFYGPPRGGILPLGGAAGHKGFALGLLVEVLGSALAGLASTDPTVSGNGLCFVVIDPSAFVPLVRFRELVDGLVAYVKSSAPAPGFEEVLVPGEPEFRTLRQRRQSGVPVDEVTWNAINEHSRRLGVDGTAVVPLP